MNIDFKRIAGLLALSLCIFLCIVSCKKKEKNKEEEVTLENAQCVTYDYLATLAKEKISEKGLYCYNIDELVTIEDIQPASSSELDGISVSDEEVESSVDDIYKYYAARTEKTEGKVSEGDIITVDLYAYSNNELIEGQSLENYEYKLGTQLIDELNEKLVGVKIGETFDIPCKFSEDYYNAAFAGKEVLFTITVKSVVEYNYCELTPEFFASIATDRGEEGKYTDEESFRKYIYDKIYNERYEKTRAQLLDNAWNTLLDEISVNVVPTKDYDGAFNQVMEYLKSEYEKNGADYDNIDAYLEAAGYKNTSQELAKESADKYIKEKLLAVYIAKKNAITVTDDEFNACVAEYAAKNGFDDNEAFLNELKSAKETFILERYYELIYTKAREYAAGINS